MTGRKTVTINGELTQYQLALSVARKIRFQFPRTTYGQLQWAVIERALRDSVETGNTLNKRQAIRFLQEDMENAEICGVRSDWVRKVIELSELKL